MRIVLPVLIHGIVLELGTGHAFEARIYAENVPRGFLPAAGTLHHYCPVPVSQTGKTLYIYIERERDSHMYVHVY